MTRATGKSIIAKQYGNIPQETFVANAALSPGHLLYVLSTGKVAIHATSGAPAIPPMFAFEDDLQGKGVDDAYASADQVQVIFPRRGDEVYAMLADDQTIAIGDFLESNGDGCLKKWVKVSDDSLESNVAATIDHEQPQTIVGVAMEALDLSESSGDESSGLVADQRIRIKVY